MIFKYTFKCSMCHLTHINIICYLYGKAAFTVCVFHSIPHLEYKQQPHYRYTSNYRLFMLYHCFHFCLCRW